jgi:hypothetical protein
LTRKVIIVISRVLSRGKLSADEMTKDGGAKQQNKGRSMTCPLLPAVDQRVI